MTKYTFLVQGVTATVTARDVETAREIVRRTLRRNSPAYLIA